MTPSSVDGSKGEEISLSDVSYAKASESGGRAPAPCPPLPPVTILVSCNEVGAAA